MKNGVSHMIIYVLKMTGYLRGHPTNSATPFQERTNKHNAYLTLIIFLVNNMMILFKIWETKAGDWS